MDQAKKFFQWKGAFEVDVAKIDEQHRSFLELLNKCYDSIYGSTEDVINIDLVEKLESYIAMHFSYEEGILESAGYEGLVLHRKQHRYFESIVADLESDHSRGKTSALKILPDLRDWFLHHILEEDMKYVPYLYGKSGRG